MLIISIFLTIFLFFVIAFITFLQEKKYVSALILGIILFSIIFKFYSNSQEYAEKRDAERKYQEYKWN